MTFPLVNATVTRIAATRAEDYDQPAGEGAARWSGTAVAYLSDELVEDAADGRVDVLRKSTIVVPAHVATAAQTGDTITFAYAGATQTRAIQSILIDSFLGRARLALDDA